MNTVPKHVLQLAHQSLWDKAGELAEREEEIARYRERIADQAKRCDVLTKEIGELVTFLSKQDIDPEAEPEITRGYRHVHGERAEALVRRLNAMTAKQGGGA